MSNIDMIKELRALTSAGMKDCKEALEEANWDLSAAVDIIKVKGLNIADARSGKVASEGMVWIVNNTSLAGIMLEVNCQTDFVSQSPEFKSFARKTVSVLCDKWNHHQTFQASDVEADRQEIVSKTKENIVVRRWWVEEALAINAGVFSYVHSNNKIGVLLTLLASSAEARYSPEFIELGDNLAMQIAAMNPLAISSDRLLAEDVERQKAIFETQLKELNKPQTSWAKIMEGKFRKWYTEVCLLEQDAVWLPKTIVRQAIKDVSVILGGEVQVINFIRCEVGEGIETKKDNLAEEVAKLM